MVPETLRARLDEEGFSRFDVILPGEDDVAPLEGAIVLEPIDGEWVVSTVDYGVRWPLGVAPTEEAAGEALLQYLGRPLPPARRMPQAELDGIVDAVSIHYFELRDRARDAGPDGVVIDIPPAIALDRIGALDGIHLFPIDTPFELRSLPPSALRPENDVHAFVTRGTVRVRAVIVPPWFGRPGGGLRFTIQEPRVGIRDLVVAGVLERIERV